MPTVELPVAAFLRETYGLQASTLRRLPGENDNVLVTTPEAERYVLKILAPDATPEALALEQAVSRAAASGGIPVPGLVPALDGSETPRFVAPEAPPRLARLMPFLSGTAWKDAGPASGALLCHAGQTIARVQAALSSVDSPEAHRTHLWDPTAMGDLRPRTRFVADPARRAMADEAFRLWAGAKPYLADLPAGLVHADLNDENLLVDGDRIVGVLDFDDALVNPYACDLAVALAYLLLDQPEPLAAGAEIVAGYHRERPLAPIEIEVLYPLMVGRLAVSLVMSAERRGIDPERAEWFATEDRAWALLDRLLQVDPIDAADALASGVEVDVFAERGASPEALLERRQRRIGGALKLHFREPVRFIRGRGNYLFDDRGLPYLDLYNNVCHVGHCHPRVVEAAHRQMARLNTNTRYLYDGLLDYADRICATLPEPLARCFVVNSGSEANELALRLARAHTGRRDVIVLENAYHGHTQTLIDISPYKFDRAGGSGKPDWVHIAPMPDGYRGPFKGQGREAGIAFGDAVGRVISELERPPMAFIAESLPSVGGQIIPPEAYFETALGHVRASGGVCILDEVQVGFGRVGTHLWGFEQQGVVPDIVVMGKPIGNGHPMGLVVTTDAIAQSLADSGMEFFSTFGGNPVSCAIGLAVLDVIEDEGLQQHALEVGGLLRDGLRGLMDRHALIGDVRGTGLFIGVELVEDRETLAPATRAARALVDGLRQRRILTGTDGPFDSVVKIKPPMTLSEEDARAAVEAVDAVLAGVEEASGAGLRLPG